MIGDSNRKWWILAAMGGDMSILPLDETVVAVALRTIRNDLGMSLIASHWVINAYLLVFTCFAAAGDFRIVFMATTVLTIAVLALTWLWFETENVAEAKA